MGQGLGVLEALSSLLRRGPAPDPGPQRWIVLDVEASGLDARHDRLLAVAALALHIGGPGQAPRIALGDSFEGLLQQPGSAAAPDKANILVHGIGLGAQRHGRPAAELLAAFEHYRAGAPLIAFHAAFDRTMLERHSRAALGRALPGPWLDLAPLAAVLHPEVRARALDDWLAHFGIPCLARHQAAADTLATAELLLALWPRLRQELGERAGFTGLLRLADQQRWVQR
jgi:DNA polymerase-3 subunit epsilon